MKMLPVLLVLHMAGAHREPTRRFRTAPSDPLGHATCSESSPAPTSSTRSTNAPGICLDRIGCESGIEAIFSYVSHAEIGPVFVWMGYRLVLLIIE